MDELDGDGELAQIARFAAKLCYAEIALVSIVEEERQRFLAKEGIDTSETPRSWSFCAHAMLGSEAMIVLDAREHPTFATNPLVTGEPFIRFYAGMPLISPEGAPLGSLCVIDTKPRAEALDEFQLEGLEVLAAATRRRLDAHRSANRAVEELALSAQRVQFVLDSVPDIAWSAAPGGTFDYFNARWSIVTGLEPPKTVDDWRQVIHPEDYDASLEKFTAAVEKAELFEDEWRMRQADGSYRWVLSRAVPSTHDPETARWYGTLTDIDDAYRISQERELLAGELAHRIKNIFTVIIGLIALHSRGDKTMKVFGDMLADNIRALARAQEFALQIGNQSEDRLDRLLSVLMAPYGTAENSRVTIKGDDVPIGKRATTPLALAFHEFATNSAKYGALSEADGKVEIAIEKEGEIVSVTWTEVGGPEVVAPLDSGFGSRLLQMSITGQLGGEIEHDWRRDGLHAVIRVPAERLAQ
ncbi:sensor histidine kinase [Erythrobacter sp. THAF29]|uniref:sensor histidine kinase n=1 Tax=Erythrobacter sp. THAF29 TaxID=2587851 RepID=UPI001268C413|nr:PAS domain-containing protein [Erythrobacter sp. THAF29]QFT76606.1 Blue-light-activated histidine kinase 1 [Erythrobacter sp. THAF29]